jgi:hypothetical protein
MVTSLADFCVRLDAATSLVVQVDRRQVADRRTTRRGGRRGDDVNAATDPLDMRSVAIRRALISSHPSMSSVDENTHADTRFAVTGGPIDSAARRLATAAGRQPLE